MVEQGKGEQSGAKLSGAGQAGEGQVRQGQAKQGRGGGEEQKKGDQQRFPLSSSSSKLLRFFFGAIAPFTGIGGVPSDRLFFVCTQVKIAGSGEIGGFVPAFTEEKALSTLDVILENH